MPEYTPLKKLYKPSRKDQLEVDTTLSENFSIIDGEFGKIENEIKNTNATIDQLVIEGDSSVEAAQARLSADGQVYDTLKERLDTEHQSTASLLAEKVTKTGGMYNVADFGLKGDNTNDAAAFMAMLNAVPSGARIQFSKGTYNLSSLAKPYTMPDKVLYFYGVSRSETIIKGSIGRTNSFNLMNSFKMQDIQLQDWHFIELKKTASTYNFLTFKDCKFENCSIPAYCFDDTIEVRKFTFNDNEVTNSLSACRLGAKVRSSDMNYNELKNLTQTGFQIGSDMSEGESYKVSLVGNKIDGIVMNSSYRAAMLYANEIKATDNFIENMSFAAGVVKANYVLTAIYIRSFAKLSTIANNTFKNIDGWAVQVKDATGKVSIVNNQIYNDNIDHTISRGFHISVAKHINIDSNHFEGLKNTLPIWCTATVGVITRNTIVNCDSDVGIRIESVAGGSMTVKDNEIETRYKTGVQNYSIVGYSIANGHIDISGNKLKNIGEKGTKYGVYILMGVDTASMRNIKIVNNSLDNMMYGFGVRGSATPVLSYLRIQHNDLFNTTMAINSNHIATKELIDSNTMVA